MENAENERNKEAHVLSTLAKTVKEWAVFYRSHLSYRKKKTGLEQRGELKIFYSSYFRTQYHEKIYIH